MNWPTGVGTACPHKQKYRPGDKLSPPLCFKVHGRKAYSIVAAWFNQSRQEARERARGRTCAGPAPARRGMLTKAAARQL